MKKSLVAAAIVALALTACGKKEEPAKPVPAPEPTTAPAPAPAPEPTTAPAPAPAPAPADAAKPADADAPMKDEKK